MRSDENKLRSLVGNRIFWLDVARCFAIVAVVLIHINEGISYNEVYSGAVRVSASSWFFQNSIHLIGRLGVPIFLMISGGIVLKKTIEDPLVFYKTKLVPLVTATISWILIYNIFNLFYFKQEISIDSIIREILTGNIVSTNQLWYMSIIIGLYIAAPFISIMVNKLSMKSLIIFVLIGSIYYLVLPVVNIYAVCGIIKMQKVAA